MARRVLQADGTYCYTENCRIHDRSAHSPIGWVAKRRDELITDIAEAAEAHDWDAYEQHVSDLHALDRSYPHTTTGARPATNPALVARDTELAERDALIEHGSRVDLEAFLAERQNRPEFVQLLADRDETRAKAKLLKAEYKFLKDAYDEGLRYGAPLVGYDEVRTKGNELLNAFEDLQVLKYEANEYKDVTAPVAARISELVVEERQAAGTYREYTADTLNGLVEAGDFPSGSREWLENRQQGVGGSDVGKIIGVYKPKQKEGYEDVMNSKLNPITDEEVEAQAAGHTAFSGPTGRGNAWEELVVQRYAEAHPEENITHCKTSWKNSAYEYQYANFDGLMTDENGVPNGILEIKTASDASKWGDPAAGLDAVPPGYRAQVLWYCQAAGFKKGAIAVLIDDREYREYPFTITPELEAEAERNLNKVKDFVDIWQRRRVDPTAVDSRHIRKGIGITHVQAARTLKDKAFKEVALYREEPIATVRQRYFELTGGERDEEVVREALRTLYIEKDPATRTKNIVHVDIETSGNSPTSGRIIEVGISVTDPAGNEVKKYQQTYGIPRKMERIGDTGHVEVHQITASQIARKRQFTHPDVQREVLDILKNDGIMNAHNLPYEVQWFKQHLPGFAEAYDNGEIAAFDNMSFTRKFLPTKTNRLKETVEFHGDEYVDAHRAYNDVSMQSRALVKTFEFIHSLDPQEDPTATVNAAA